MIERVVFSYFNSDEEFVNKCGFIKYSDFLFTTALATWTAAQHFKEVHMVSTSWGVEMFRELGLPVTHYNTKLDEMKDVSGFFWAFGKLLAYNEQDVPFVHVDNDVFMWDPLPKRILKAELCFQSHEPMNLDGYKYYEMLKPSFNDCPVRPQQIVDNPVTDFGYNCGICGGHRLQFFKEWIDCSRMYIFAPENQEIFFRKHKGVLVHQNLFHEQYFAASLIKMHDLRKKVKVIDPDVMKIPEKLKYTHLWGTTKRDFSMMRRVNMRLQIEDPDLHKRIVKFCKKNNI